MGGFLAEKDLYVGIPIFETRPYLLSCIIGISLAIVGIISTYFLLDEANPKGAYLVCNKRENEFMSPNSAIFAHEMRRLRGNHKVVTASSTHSFNRRGDSPIIIQNLSPSLSSLLAVTPVEPSSPLSAKSENRILQSISNSELITTHETLGMLENFQNILSKVPTTSIIPVTLYCLFALGCSVNWTIVSLLASSSKERGGYHLSPSQTSVVWTVRSIFALVVQVAFLPLQSYFGASKTLRFGLTIMIPATLALPWRLFNSNLIGLHSFMTIQGLVSSLFPY